MPNPSSTLREITDRLVTAFAKDPMDFIMVGGLFLMSASMALLLLAMVVGLACGAIK